MLDLFWGLCGCFGISYLSTVFYDRVWPCMAFYGLLWSFMVLLGLVGSCWVLLSLVGSLMILFDLIQPIANYFSLSLFSLGHTKFNDREKS